MGYWNEDQVKETKDDHIELEQLESECLDELGEVEKSFRERMGAETNDSVICVILNTGAASASPAAHRKRNFLNRSISMAI